MIGEFAKSKAGHDKEKIYVIMDEQSEYVYLADGKYRTVDKLKKKKVKHIQIIHKSDSQISQKLLSKQMITNEEIKVAIKNCFR